MSILSDRDSTTSDRVDIFGVLLSCFKRNFIFTMSQPIYSAYFAVNNPTIVENLEKHIAVYERID